jgi:polyphosphate kinase 2 (PPK2 family)
MDDAKQFRVNTGNQVNLAMVDAGYQGDHENEQSTDDEQQEYLERLSKLQGMMYSENKHSLLVILQAMDAGGKDRTIRHVESLDPKVVAESFKVPRQRSWRLISLAYP